MFNTLIKKMAFFDSLSNHLTSNLFLGKAAGTKSVFSKDTLYYVAINPGPGALMHLKCSYPGCGGDHPSGLLQRTLP